MARFKAGQTVWIPMVVAEIEPEDGLDLKLRLDDGLGDTDCVWISSEHREVLPEAPQQPKPPAPVRLFGHTIFDLANCVHITDVRFFKSGSENEKQYSFTIEIIRANEESTTYFYFDTKEEAEAARALIEKKVLEAKGIDDDDTD